MIEIKGKQIDPNYYVKKWTDWALEATSATDEQVKANVKTFYRKAKLKEPEVIVFRDYDKFLANDWDSVQASVWDSVGASVWASVGASVGASVWASVGASVQASVWASVGASVGASVWASVGASVWASVGASVGASVQASVGAWHWADDLAFADVFVDAGVLSKGKATELEEYRKLLETQRIGVLTEDTAYALVAPTIRRENGRLHSDQRPAVEWENGTGMYFLDGVEFPKELWEKVLSGKMTFAEIMKIDISDRRTVALKHNPKAIIVEGSELVHSTKRGNELYRIENKKVNEELNAPKIWFLRMKCPTGRTFIEGVPPDAAEALPDADAMQALLCGLTYEQYQEMKLES